jgi:hypothetical protein
MFAACRLGLLLLCTLAPAAETPPVEPVVADSSFRSLDPVAEGWETEAFAEAAQLEIKRLLEPLAHPGASWVLVPGGRFGLIPARRSVASLDHVIIERGGPVSSTDSLVDSEEAFRSLASLFKAGAEVRVKVKTVAVTAPTRPGGGGATNHLVQFYGPSAAEGQLEINATWSVKWNAGATGQPGTIREALCLAWEQVATRKSGLWFNDQTDAVLGSAEVPVEQFAAGISAWRLRLQASLPLHKFGYHGLAVADVNGDGLEDVYVCQPGGLPNRLLIHRADDTVKEAAAEWGVDLLDACQSAVFADFDNDGDPDLVVATTGPLVFFENTGTSFVARIRLPPVLHAFGMAAADYDADGDVDVYVARYYPSAKEGGELAIPMPYFNANNGGPNFLIRNDGPSGPPGWLRMSDATAEVGLDHQNRRFSFAAVWDDINNDSLPDLYVANDFGRNNVFVQSRDAGGKVRFVDVTEAAGAGDGAFGMSASSGDVNRDGWVDLHLGAMFSSAGSRITTQDRFRPELPEEVRGQFRRLARGNTLFLNRAKPTVTFEDISVAAGITMGRWSWASLFADINCDAWPDLLVANGFVTGEIPDDL